MHVIILMTRVKFLSGISWLVGPRCPRNVLPKNSIWESGNRGGKTYRAIFGGGGTYHRVPPPKPVLEASESGICLVCACFLWGKWQGVNKRGRGETYHRWGGPKPFLGIGGAVQNRFWGGRGFMVFHPPLFFSALSLGLFFRPDCPKDPAILKKLRS